MAEPTGYVVTTPDGEVTSAVEPLGIGPEIISNSICFHLIRKVLREDMDIQRFQWELAHPFLAPAEEPGGNSLAPADGAGKRWRETGLGGKGSRKAIRVAPSEGIQPIGIGDLDDQVRGRIGLRPRGLGACDRWRREQRHERD